MANICNQRLYIVSETESDAKDLYLSMWDMFKQSTKADPTPDLNPSSIMDDFKSALEKTTRGYNPLCLLLKQPDVRSEGGIVEVGKALDKPCISINMDLKSGPSHGIADYCASLSKEKYGYAVINGGEYMQEDGGTVFIQYGEKPGDSFYGGLDYDEFVSWSNQVADSVPRSLDEFALYKLFQEAEASCFFPFGTGLSTVERINSVAPGLVDEIVEFLEMSCKEELCGEFGSDFDYIAIILEENGNAELASRLKSALGGKAPDSNAPSQWTVDEILSADANDPTLVDEIAKSLGYQDRNTMFSGCDYDLDNLDDELRTRFVESKDMTYHRLRLRFKNAVYGEVDELADLEKDNPELYNEIVMYCSENSWSTGWEEALSILSDEDDVAKELLEKIQERA